MGFLNIPGLCSLSVCTLISLQGLRYFIVQHPADCSPFHSVVQQSLAEESSSSSSTRSEGNDPNRYCRLCCAPFSNPLVAQQHYGGKKHRRSEARKKILEELGDKGVPAESGTCGKQDMSMCCSL